MEIPYKLENYTIHELRELGRQFGVKSPASLKKMDLINAINGILSGKTKPISVGARRGRPLKYRAFEIKDSSAQQMFASSEDVIRALSFSDMDFSQLDVDDSEKREAAGFCRVLADGNGILRKNSCKNADDEIFIHSSLIFKHGIKSGDKLSVSYSISYNTSMRVAIDILSINDGYLPSESEKNFENLGVKYPYERILLDENSISSRLVRQIFELYPIAKGQRLAFLFDKKSVMFDAISALSRDINRGSGCFVLPVYLGITPEAAAEITDDCNAIYSNFDASYTCHIELVNFACEIAKRHVELGADVVMLVDLSKLAQAYAINGDLTKIPSDILLKIKNIVSFGRVCDNGGSFTALFLIDENDKYLDLSEICDIFSGVISIKTDIVRQKCVVDAAESYLKYEGKYLSEHELEALIEKRNKLL